MHLSCGKGSQQKMTKKLHTLCELSKKIKNPPPLISQQFWPLFGVKNPLNYNFNQPFPKNLIPLCSIIPLCLIGPLHQIIPSCPIVQTCAIVSLCLTDANQDTKPNHATITDYSKDPPQGTNPRNLSKEFVQGTCPRNPSKDPVQGFGQIEYTVFKVQSTWVPFLPRLKVFVNLSIRKLTKNVLFCFKWLKVTTFLRFTHNV